MRWQKRSRNTHERNTRRFLWYSHQWTYHDKENTESRILLADDGVRLLPVRKEVSQMSDLCRQNSCATISSQHTLFPLAFLHVRNRHDWNDRAKSVQRTSLHLGSYRLFHQMG